MNRRIIYALFLVISLTFLGGCGGGGGSGSAGTGTVSLDIADAKPFIDGEQPDELWVIFDEVLVHTSGEGWVSLDLAETPPFEINLLAYNDGLKTEFATPTTVRAGHVTQIRFVISRAYMVFYGNPDDRTEEILVPSEKLRTDKQIDWTLTDGGVMSLTVHFDLSQSIVQSGQGYKLNPVLHLFNNEPQEAATICGSITADSFAVEGDHPGEIAISVIRSWMDGAETYNETYTVVTVPKDPDADETGFCIYWLVPLVADESYIIQIDNGFDDPIEEVVEATEEDQEPLAPGERFDLNGGNPISIAGVT